MKLQKETKGRDIHGRWYGDACGTAFGLEILGERWSLLVIRELMFGPRRFSDLRASLPGISAKVLTERLATLEEAGVLVRRKLAPPAASRVYELTEWGYRAEPVIQEMGRWAVLSEGHDPTLPLSPASLMMSMRTMQKHGAMASAPDMCGRIVVGGDGFDVSVEGGTLHMARADSDARAGDFTLRAEAAPPIAGLLYADIPIEAMVEQGAVTVEGDAAKLALYLDLFALPPKITG